MKKRWAAIVLVLAIMLSWGKITGYFAEGIGGPPEEEHSIGPPPEEMECMKPCVSQGCEADDMACKMRNSERCMAECNAGQPEPQDEGERCMQECVIIGCGQADFECEKRNMDKCERECGMIGPEPGSEEEVCIMECVAKVDPSIICEPGKEGEQGNEVCQRCAQECVHLYAGPCLNDEQITMKEKECETCEHCYGEPVMGDSGAGYECIANIKCMDASGEFGDEPGEGPGIVGKVGETVTGAAKGFFGFLKNLFGLGSEEPEE